MLIHLQSPTLPLKENKTNWCGNAVFLSDARQDPWEWFPVSASLQRPAWLPQLFIRLIIVFCCSLPLYLPILPLSFFFHLFFRLCVSVLSFFVCFCHFSLYSPTLPSFLYFYISVLPSVVDGNSALRFSGYDDLSTAHDFGKSGYHSSVTQSQSKSNTGLYDMGPIQNFVKL